MIVTLKISYHKVWSADIELDEGTTLDELHRQIQRAVKFDNDHLYEFYVARGIHGRKQAVYDGEDGDPF